MVKENFIYVGIDLHKETHTAVMIDCYNQKLGEITFPNRPADFPKLVTKVKKCNTEGKEVQTMVQMQQVKICLTILTNLHQMML